ncbi:MAG: tripartite tricarboxylate transporter substrate binding protein [Microbacteriaceae bacterium]|nr:tripartite tricarboxylate transporter substrate binding protein [Burkholderiaceae bacterium]
MRTSIFWPALPGCCLALLFAATLMPAGAAAQDAFPSRPVRILVPYPAGGVPDMLTRAVAEKVAATWGQPIVVDARPGASGNIAAMALKGAPADGYTVMMGAPFLVINPLLDPNTRFAASDFSPVVLIAASPNVLVVPSTLPVNTLREFVAYARERPGKLNSANHGTGTSNQMGTELLMSVTNIDMTMVGYKGQVQSIPDFLAGQLDFMFLSSSMAVPHQKAGKLKILAVSADHRLEALADVPTVGEAGYPDAVMLPWFGIVAPAGTPAPIVDRINAEFTKALQDPVVIKRLQAMYAMPMGGTPADFQKLLMSEATRWAAVIKKRNIQPVK